MTTDQAFDKMEQLLPYFTELFNDPEAGKLVKSIREQKGQSLVGDTMNEVLPLFLGKHRRLLYSIISVAHDKSIEDAMAQPIAQTIADIRTSMVNETIMMLMSCLNLVKNL